MWHIRRISVHVGEPEPGRFFWVLMDEGDDKSHWLELKSAADSCEMWLDALQAGVVALEGYAQDERIGPRSSGDDEDANPVREQAT